MAFAAFHLLAGIIPSRFAVASGFDRLTIHNGGAWLGLLASYDTGQFAQAVKHLIPNAVAAPLQVIVVDVTVIREIVRQHFPLAAGFIKIEDRIGDLANIDRPRPAWARVLSEEWCNPFPRFVMQISWVRLSRGLPAHATLLSVRATSFRTSSTFYALQRHNF